MTADVTIDEYGADQITALEGLQPVRLRPGMYIGSTTKAGLHHLLWEVVDNSVDEAMAGHCDVIGVKLNADNSITVKDNGRGIPVEPQKAGSYKGMPTVEMVMTVLHAGGKFGEGAYQFSGGLHGVGISVVNALSEWTVARVRVGGKIHSIEFGAIEQEQDGRTSLIPGAVTSPLSEEGTYKRGGSGTEITFLPDYRVFSTMDWDSTLIARRLRHAAFLNPGLTFTLEDARSDETSVEEFCYPNGLNDFMDEVTEERISGDLNHEAPDEEKKTKLDQLKQGLLPPDAIFLVGEDNEIRGKWEMCFRWFPDTRYHVQSFANGIETGHGGTHVKGYENVLTRIMNRYAKQDHIDLLDGDSKLEAVDVRSGLGVIISVKVKEPQFVGQTKDELSNEETKGMISQQFNEMFWDWMEEHPVETRAILEKMISSMRFRYRMAELEQKERNKAEKSGMAARSGPLPHKLADCSTKTRSDAELFIVEGDSAAGPAIKTRNPRTQAVLPIRGKGLNIEKAIATGRYDRIESNKEVQGLINTIGAGSEELFDEAQMRYGRIVILTDADDDGRHIELLLMTMFYRLMPDLVNKGHLYVARPPLFSTTLKGEKVYLHSEESRLKFVDENPRHNGEFLRFKGLGEMNPRQLGETSMNPDSRSLARIMVEDVSIADNAIAGLMGTDANFRWDTLQSVDLNEKMD